MPGPYWEWWDQPLGYPDMTLPTATTYLNAIPGDYDILAYTRLVDGNTIQLSPAFGAVGRMAPPIEVYEDTVPLRPGSQPRGTRWASSDIQVPIHLVDGQSIRTPLRTLIGVLNPTLGRGFLYSIQGPSDDRFKFVVYSGGLEQTPEPSSPNIDAVITFHASDPYWYTWDATDFDTVTPGYANLGPLNAFDGHTDGAGTPTSVSSVTFNNNSDADVWPVIDILGDSTNTDPISIEYANGQSMVFTEAITVDMHLTIDMRPQYKTITLANPDGTGAVDWWPKVTAGTGDLHIDPNYTQTITIKNGSGTYQQSTSRSGGGYYGRAWIWIRRGWLSY